MEFFIALGAILSAASAYLLYQFWSGSMSIDDMPPHGQIPADTNSTETLKAA